MAERIALISRADGCSIRISTAEGGRLVVATLSMAGSALPHWPLATLVADISECVLDTYGRTHCLQVGSGCLRLIDRAEVDQIADAIGIEVDTNGGDHG